MPNDLLPDLKKLKEPKSRKQVITEASKTKGVMPLDYMLSVVRDPTATQERRDRMAIAAAPYCHPRISEQVKGKKDQREDAAKIQHVGTPWAQIAPDEVRAN